MMRAEQVFVQPCCNVIKCGGLKEGGREGGKEGKKEGRKVLIQDWVRAWNCIGADNAVI